MKCPLCETKMGVIESRESVPGIMRRRRKCHNDECGHRVTTEERVVATPTLRPRGHAISEQAMALAEERRRRLVDARRQNENRTLAKELGLNPEDLSDE